MRVPSRSKKTAGCGLMGQYHVLFPRPNRISHGRPDAVAHALVRAVSRLFSTPAGVWNSLSGPGVGKSADAARKSACATSLLPTYWEKCAALGSWDGKRSGQFGRGDGSGAEFADGDSAGAVGQVGGLGGLSAGGQGQGEYGDGGIAGAGDIEDGLGAGGHVARRGIAFEEQHAVLAESDEQAARVPQPAQAASGFEQGLVLKHRRDRFGRRKAGGEKGFGAVGLHGGRAAPGK